MKTCFVFVNVDIGKESESINEINKLPNAKVIFEIIGAFDFIVKVEAITDEELRNTIFKIRDIKFRRSTLTLVEQSSWRKKN